MPRRPSFVADRKTAKVKGSEVLDELTRGPNLRETMGLDDSVPHVKARKLVGHTFVILAAAQFRGTMKKASPTAPDPWYVVGLESNETFTTVLGGQVVSEALEAWAAKEITPRPPLEVTLQFVEAGEFNGYYTFRGEEVAPGEGNDEELPF